MTLKRKVAAKLPEIEKNTKIWSKVCISVLDFTSFESKIRFKNLNENPEISVLHRWSIRVNTPDRSIGPTISKLNHRGSVRFTLDLDRSLWPQLYASAR